MIILGVELNHEELDRLLDNLKEVSSKVLEYMAMDFWSVSVEEAPIKKGTLRASIQSEQQDDLTWIVGTNLEYAVPVHEGYDSFPLDSPVNIDGQWVYIKTHPGYSGNPFFDRTTEIIEGRIETYLDLAMADIQ
jgi:hypothetical protein